MQVFGGVAVAFIAFAAIATIAVDTDVQGYLGYATTVQNGNFWIKSVLLVCLIRLEQTVTRWQIRCPNGLPAVIRRTHKVFTFQGRA
jgi:hypothetical protein